MKHTFIALLRDRPGALNRAVNVFRRRGLNIEQLTVAATERAGISRMTVVVETDDAQRLLRQFEQLIDVLKLHDAAVGDAETPFTWQADGASDDAAA